MFQSLFFWNGLWDMIPDTTLKTKRRSFNPCFSGMAFGTEQAAAAYPSIIYCFNPCFSGMAFGTPSGTSSRADVPMFQSLFFWNGLWDHGLRARARDLGGFNPCFSGMAFGTSDRSIRAFSAQSFNPCFSGMAFGTHERSWPAITG